MPWCSQEPRMYAISRSGILGYPEFVRYPFYREYTYSDTRAVQITSAIAPGVHSHWHISAIHVLDQLCVCVCKLRAHICLKIYLRIYV